MLKVGQLVRVVDENKVKQDPLLEENALKVMESSNFTGEVTKIEGDIHFVGFMNDYGWLTKGFKSNEIKEVE